MGSVRSVLCAVTLIATVLTLPATALGSGPAVVALRSSPPGLELSVDGETLRTPAERSFAVGARVTLGAPASQLHLGYDYTFGSWSGQGAGRVTTITVPDADTTVEAAYRFSGRRTALGTDAVGDHVAEAGPGQAAAYRVLATRSGTQDALRLYVDPTSTASGLSLGLYADAGGRPGALLGAGSAPPVEPGAFAEVALAPQPRVSAGGTYWIGLLNPASGVLRWRDGAGADASPSLGGLGAALGAPAWATGAVGGAGPLSGYGVGPAPAAPGLGVDIEPARLVFSGGAPPAQTIAVQANSGGCGPCGWQAAADAAWLSVTPSSGDWPTEVTVSVDPSGLAPGVHRAGVSVGRAGAIGATVIPVTLHVVAPDDDLVGAWSFDEASGSTASDSSGHGNAAQIAGAQRTTAGAYGGALSFEGDGDVVSVAANPSLDFGSGATVEGWVRPNVLAGPLITREGSWTLSAGDASGLPSASFVAARERTARSSARLPLAPNWTHLATTYDGRLIRLYVNGRLVALAPQSEPVASGGAPVRVGASARGEGFDGLIDEVRLYDRARSAAEIQADLATPLTPG